MLPLEHQCNNFLKLASELSISRIHVQENTYPFLKELSDKKSFDDRVKFCEEKFEKLGEGSSRTIFKMDEKLVLKTAHNDKGIVQNKAEMDPKMQRSCTNNVLMADAQGKWIIVRFTENLTKEKFKELTGFGFDAFMNALFYKFNNESDRWSPPRNYEEIEESKLFKCLAELVLDCDLQIGDLDKPSSYGILDGEVVLRDYGLTREIFDDYYKSTNSSSTKSSTTS